MKRLTLRPGQTHCKRFIPKPSQYAAHYECGHFMFANPTWTLVHGYFTDQEGVTLPHAWCVKGTKIFDPRLKDLFPNGMRKQLLADRKDMSESTRYTFAELEKHLRTKRRWSRFEEEWTLPFGSEYTSVKRKSGVKR